ncbi:MAG: 16S rRNA (guanine(527)-N(7))-methyltransferase RsmG [Myxococcota bacterium]
MTPATDDPATLLIQGLRALGVPPEPDRVQQLALLAHHLASWAERINLTAHRTAAEIATRLLLDAAALATVLPPFESAVDLGSGAGLPGLPLAILHPERRFVLVEARERRHHFQRSAVRELGLRNVEPLRGRAELLDPRPMDLAIAQAMGPPAQVLEWLRRWSRVGGWVALPASAGSEPPEPPDGIGLLEARSYQVPLGGPPRILWVGERTGHSD